MKILYFAWLRENVGYANEEIDLPKEIKNVSQLVNFLRNHDPIHYQFRIYDLSYYFKKIT